MYVTLEGPQDDNDTTDDTVVVIAGNTMSEKDRIIVGNNPQGVAVNQADDTVYVANTGHSERGNTLSVINGKTNERSYTIPVGPGPKGVAILRDDTVYVTSYGRSTAPAYLSIISGRTNEEDDTISIESGSAGLAIDQVDDTIYIGNSSFGKVEILGAVPPILLTPSEAAPQVALDQTTKFLYATSDDTRLYVINGATNQLDDTIVVGGPKARGVAVDQDGDHEGLVYVANGTELVVVGRVSASVGPASGLTGSTATISLDASQIDYPVDDTTVTAVCFGGAPATRLTAGTDDDTWSVTVPRGSGSNVPVTVTLDGGLRVFAGTFTYIKPPPPPPPPPPLPPGAPTDVLATPGDAQASVSWRAPLDPGSSPISRYEVTPSPSGLPCEVTPPALACDITGLANGSTYTFTVRALNDAGWGAPSTPSNEVTPRAPSHPRIVISGSRDASDARRVHVSGATTDLVGVTVTPWFRFAGQTSRSEGSARPLVQDDGSFEWTRKAGRTIYVHFTHDAVRSNSVAIRR